MPKVETGKVLIITGTSLEGDSESMVILMSMKRISLPPTDRLIRERGW